MSLTVHIHYTGENGNARKFAEEMTGKGIVDEVRREDGNIGYAYYFPMEDEETVLLIDSWKNQEALDFHHKSEMMRKIAKLREKYRLKMKVERFVSED